MDNQVIVHAHVLLRWSTSYELAATEYKQPLGCTCTLHGCSFLNFRT